MASSCGNSHAKFVRIPCTDFLYFLARKGDTPEYVNKMQHEVFEVLAKARSLNDLRSIEPKAREVYGRYLDDLSSADVRVLAIHRGSAG